MLIRINKSKSGFSIIELIIVIVIIAILASIAIVSYSWMRRDAYDAKVEATLNQVEKAFRLYTIKNNVKTLSYNSFVTNDFYATRALPTSYEIGRRGSGIGTWTIESTKGIGTELQEKGFIGADISASLKGGPKKIIYSEDILFLSCKNSVLFIIESYKGEGGDKLSEKIRGCLLSHYSEDERRTSGPDDDFVTTIALPLSPDAIAKLPGGSVLSPISINDPNTYRETYDNTNYIIFIIESSDPYYKFKYREIQL